MHLYTADSAAVVCVMALRGRPDALGVSYTHDIALFAFSPLVVYTLVHKNKTQY